MAATLRLAEQLSARPSVTPDDAGRQSLIAERLSIHRGALERLMA